MAFLDVKLTKFITEYRVMGNYVADVWEEEHATNDYEELLRIYRDCLRNGRGRYKVIHKQIPNPDYGRFKYGQKVRTHPATGAFMQGFRTGKIVKVGRKYVTVAWSMNPAITRKFYPQDIEPLDEME